MPDPAEQSLIQRMLIKAMALLDRQPGRLAKPSQYGAPSEWKAMEPLKPLTDSPEDIEFYNDITLADESRKYDNIEQNMFEAGIPDTVFDTRVTPMNEKTQGRWQAFKGDRPHKVAQELLYKATSGGKFKGGPQVVLPAGTRLVEKEDMHPRDPFRSVDAFKTPFAEDPKNPGTRARVQQSSGLTRKVRKQQ